jgi:hypothetical protein
MRGEVNTPGDQDTGVGRRIRSMRRWRLAIGSAAVILGLVLVLTGHVLVGVVIGGLAAARLVMFSRFTGGRRGPGISGSDREWLRAQVPDEFVVAAQAIGCPTDELRAQWERGRSIAEVATQHSVGLNKVTAAITADLTERAHEAERAGTLSGDAARRVDALAPRFADRIVHRHRVARRG